MTKKIFIFLIMILFLSLGLKTESKYWRSEKYLNLIGDLEKLGFSESEIDSLFSDSRLKFYPTIIKKIKTTKVPKLTGPNSKLLSEESVNKGKEFIKDNIKLLEKAEKEYGVEKEIIVAILKLESDLGQNLGSYQAFGIFNSIVFYSKSDSRRSQWAKNELVALLSLCQKLGISPFKIKSSWAGAIGICQFLPTSCLAFGVDGNSDGKVNLFELEDVIFSIANYLTRHGWKKDEAKAIYSYNHSLNYVQGILAYAKKIKE